MGGVLAQDQFAPQLALDDDKTYGLTIGTLKQALKSRGWEGLWSRD